MDSQIVSQLYSFFIFLLTGFLIGILFDIFRISRKTFKTTDFITYIEDITFWILTGIFIIFTIFKFNNGEIRLYIIFSMIIGLIIYALVFSKIFIKVSVTILSFIKNIISKIINIVTYPVKIIIKVLKKIFSPLIKFTKKMSKIILKNLKVKNKKNNSDIKKDFA